VNAKEAARRQKVIQSTLDGLKEILETGLKQELDPQQELELMRLINLGGDWMFSSVRKA
jgi:hypothetical protein